MEKKGEADGGWIGPMQVIIQENQNVVWVTRHHKLFRVPPEYVRSLSAMEEFQHASTKESPNTSGDKSIRPSHGGVQYHDLIPSVQDTVLRVPAEMPGSRNRQSETLPLSRTEGSTEAPPAATSPVPSHPLEQPDNEPEVHPFPHMITPIIIP
mgnify:CR=1 FL=1